MKKYLVAGLVTAVFALGLISQADAASRYCMENPDDQRCSQNDGLSYPPIKDGNGYQVPSAPPPPPVYNDGNGDVPPPPPPRRYGDNGNPPPPQRWHRRHRPNYNDNYDYYDNGYDQGALFSFQFGNGSNSCSDIADSLSESGFRRVRAVDCAGRDFAYLAVRDGQRLRLRVKAATGRIFAISPY